MIISSALIVILLILSSFFSAAETSILNVSQAKINKLKNDGNKRAISLLKLREDKEKLIGCILLGSNFANVGASAVATGMCIDIFGDNNIALLIATTAMATIILVIAEVLPKTYAVRYSEIVALFIAPLMSLIALLFTPVVLVVKYVVNRVIELIDRNPTQIDVSALDSIKSTIELHHNDGEVISDYKYMLGGVIDLEKITVEEVMVHRNEFYSIDIGLNAQEVVKLIVQSPNSRIPLWKDSPDNIIGILHAKDINKFLIAKKNLSSITTNDIISLSREPWFIPNTTNLKAQIVAFKQRHYLFALVVNEYGELEGLVTLEDIIEEVIGQIEDEYDIIQKGIFKINTDGSVVVSGNTTIRDLNRELEWDIKDEHATTIGGLLFHIAQGVPELSQTFQHDKYSIKSIKKKKNKVLKVKIWPTQNL